MIKTDILKNPDKVKEVGFQVKLALIELEKFFKDDMYLTFIARSNANNERYLIITSDDTQKILGTLQYDIDKEKDKKR